MRLMELAAEKGVNGKLGLSNELHNVESRERMIDISSTLAAPRWWQLNVPRNIRVF